MFRTTITDIFFDLDHTLWDFDKNSALAFDQIFKKDFPQVDATKFIEVYVPINQACWKLYQNDEITHQQLRYNRLKQSFDALNFQISDVDIDKIATNYIELLPENNLLFDNTIEILEYLKPKYNLHIITNGFADVQTKKLKNSNIVSYFKTVTNSEMAGAKKPNPIIFEFALNKAKAQKKNSIMIGDCIDADVNGALQFGMNAIYFNEKNVKTNSDIIQISNLIQLKNVL